METIIPFLGFKTGDTEYTKSGNSAAPATSFVYYLLIVTMHIIEVS